MNIQQALQAEHSKTQSHRIADHIGANPVRFAMLMDLCLGNDPELARRAAWTVGHCTDRHPELILPHLESIFARLRGKTHVAIRRNLVRALQFIDLPEEWLGEAADICFTYLANHNETAAVRVFSMTALWNICQQEPDLAHELKLLIEEHLPYATAGFKNRGNKILAAIHKQR